MILPSRSRSIRSIGWITRVRTCTTSPGLMLDGIRMRTLPMSAMVVLASAPADGDLDLALDLPERAVALLDDRADVARLAEADVRPHERLPRRGRERDPRHDGDPVLVRHDVDVLDVARRRHRRVHTHRHGDDGAVLRDEGNVELDQAPTVLDGPAPEHALHRFVEALVEPERVRAGA